MQLNFHLVSTKRYPNWCPNSWTNSMEMPRVRTENTTWAACPRRDLQCPSMWCPNYTKSVATPHRLHYRHWHFSSLSQVPLQGYSLPKFSRHSHMLFLPLRSRARKYCDSLKHPRGALRLLIKEIDDDGDAAIKFEAWKCELWVFEGDLNKLKKVPSVCTQPPRSWLFFIANAICIQNDHNGDRQDFFVVWWCSQCVCNCDASQSAYLSNIQIVRPTSWGTSWSRRHHRGYWSLRINWYEPWTTHKRYEWYHQCQSSHSSARNSCCTRESFTQIGPCDID